MGRFIKMPFTDAPRQRSDSKQEAQAGHCRSPEYNERVKKDLEVENVSANQRPGWPFCFSDRPEKQQLGRGR